MKSPIRLVFARMREINCRKPTMIRFAFTFVLLVVTRLVFAGPLEEAQQAFDAGRPAEAARKLSSLADAGNPEAQFRLGLMYFTGQGVTENEKRAYELLLKSANQGHIPAMLQLANVLTFGQQIPTLIADPDTEAAKWYFQAASAGNAEAQYSLGVLFQTGKGVVRSNEEAMHWMQQAAKNGHEGAKAYVGAVKKSR